VEAPDGLGTGAAVATGGLGLSGGKEVIDMNPSTPPSALPEGVWQTLLAHAFTLVDKITRRGISDPFWTFGGGTVLMLRPEGEIDFVASPNLTAQPYDEWTLLGRTVKVETAAEIVAKKLWHRGDRATARDLFDLSLVIEREPEALATASPYLVRHRDAFLTQIEQRRAVLRAQFEAIDALDYQPQYDEAVELASRFLKQLPAV